MTACLCTHCGLKVVLNELSEAVPVVSLLPSYFFTVHNGVIVLDANFQILNCFLFLPFGNVFLPFRID